MFKCAIAIDGDRFCDTPADPNLLGKVDGQCNYTGNAVDANGQQYQPDTTNIMSYTRSTCADKFSPEQLNKMYMVAQALNYECCRIDPPLLTDTTICAGEPVTLTASTNLPQGEVRWYDVAQGGQPIATGLQYTTEILHASKALYAEVVDSCISDRVSVLITVSPEGGLTTSSAKIFADLDTSAQGSNPYFFTEFNDSVYIFNALNLSLYYTTATSDTAHLLTDAFQSMNGGNISGLAVLGSDIIVATNSFDTGPSLWRVTYPNGDRTLLKSFGTDYGYSNFWLTTHGQHVFGQLNNTVSHPGNEIAEIWKTNGTSVGTVLVKNLAPTPAFANFEFTSFNSKLFFVGSSDAHGDELWATDGSAAGTVMIKDIFPGPTGSQISEFTIKDAQLFFTANDSLHGTELWMTDGTTAGTQLAVDINSGINGSYVYGITNIGGMLYFSADNGVDGQEPYQSDGSSAGTTQLANLRPDGSSTPHGFTQFGEIIYFRANRSVFDYELFGYSINLDETHLIKDINPTGSSTPDNLFVHDNQLFFTAFSPGVGTEIWTSDGSLNGTQMVTDIWPGAPSSNPQQFFTSGGRLLFVANDGSGAEIWQLTVPLYAACWGDSVVIEVTNSNPVKWYADSLGQVFLEEGTSFTVYDVTQTTTIYGEINEQDCTSPLYPITIFMKDDCPCVGPALLTLNEIFSQADQFTIHAQDQLHSMSHFESGSDMKFKAAGEIQFQPGFQVNLGAIFRANIEPCQE